MPEDKQGPTAPGSGSEKWVMTEKVHGANFCAITDRSSLTVSFGCRTRLLAPDDDFYNFRSSGLAEKLAKRALLVLDGSPDDSVAICVYGELFGGHYPHPDIQPVSLPPTPPSYTPQVPGLSPVQNGVWYCPQVEFIAFDVCVWTPSGTRTFLPYDQAAGVCSAASLLFAEPLARGTLSELMGRSCEFESTIPPRCGSCSNSFVSCGGSRLGLPPLPSPNLAE